MVGAAYWLRVREIEGGTRRASMSLMVPAVLLVALGGGWHVVPLLGWAAVYGLVIGVMLYRARRGYFRAFLRSCFLAAFLLMTMLRALPMPGSTDWWVRVAAFAMLMGGGVAGATVALRLATRRPGSLRGEAPFVLGPPSGS